MSREDDELDQMELVDFFWKKTVGEYPYSANFKIVDFYYIKWN
jgi:hypothetical protein